MTYPRRFPSARVRTVNKDADGMNKTESAYAAHLAGLKMLGQVHEFWFEGIKLKLAANTFYTPDFLVQFSSGDLECHEVKGFWEDDARVKIKVAADKFPMRFIAAKPRPKRDGGGFEIEEF
jgi:hypothetical protein